MSEPRVTVIMAPRERYTGLPYAIEALYRHTPTERFDLVVVDGNLPESIYAQVKELEKKHGFKFIHKPFTLTPNEGRNLGLPHIDAPYTVLLDNDCCVMDGWLDPLIKASEDFDAWLVSPTVLEDEPSKGIIHWAGGDSGFLTPEGKRHYHFVPLYSLEKLSDVGDKLQRGPTSMIEFHCMLTKSDVYDKIGPFDEQVTAFFDHDDITHLTLQAGGQVIYEPASVVSYRNPSNEAGVLQPIDLPYFYLRWSKAWADEFAHAARHLRSARYAALSWLFYALDALIHRGLFGEAFGQHVTHRGGEPIAAEHVWHVRRLMWKHTLTAPWRQGDIILVDNFRLAHARMPFSTAGKRRLWAIWAKPPASLE